MDNNPGGTPNPLSAAPGTSPEPAPTQPTTPEPITTEPTTPESVVQAPAASAMPEASEVVTESVTVESLDPSGRPMEKVAPVTDAPKKKKTGLIVGIIIGAIVLIGGIVAAVLVMMNLNKGDAVAQAMQKIMNGSAPSNVVIDGDINILVNADGSSIKRVNIDLDSDIVTGSMINTSSAVLTFTTYDNKDYSVEFDEVYAANGDIYFKIEGATAALEDSNLLELLSGNINTVVDCAQDGEDCIEEAKTNCVTNANGTTNCETTVETTYSVDVSSIYSSIIDIFEVVDGVWLKLSTEELNSMSGGFAAGESTISCVTDLVTNLNKNSNATAELYGKYPFITSTTENVLIPSKQGPVYQISLDSKNFANFANSSINSEVMNKLYSCLGYEGNVSISEKDVADLVAKMPKVYAEVNGNYDFTRLYLETDINDGAATATIDLEFSYPANVNVSEPVEYTNYSDLIRQIMSGFYNLDGVEAEVVEVKAD